MTKGTRPLLQRKFKAGKIVFHEGDQPGPAFLIKSGKAQVSIGQDPKHQKLAIIGENSIFGGMSLIDGSLRSATVKAVEDMECVVINRLYFESFFEHAHPIARTLFEIQCQRIRNLSQQLLAAQD